MVISVILGIVCLVALIIWLIYDHLDKDDCYGTVDGYGNASKSIEDEIRGDIE